MKTQTTQTQSQAQPLPTLCWVGLDWADEKHCLNVRTDPRGPGQRSFVEQKPEALDQFFLQLHRQHPHGRIAVAIEQSRGPVLYALLKYDFLVIYPVNPRALADYRRAFNVSGAKDDPRDADLLGELVTLHADRLRVLATEEPITRQLRLLTEQRRDFVADRTQASNRLQATLKCYYPLALEMVGASVCGPLALEFLRRWPNLAALKKAKPAVLRGFFYKHNSRSEGAIDARFQALAQATPLTEDPALVEPLQFQAQCLVAQLQTLAQTIAAYDRRIQELFAQHSEAWLFKDLPGAGAVMAPRLAAAFGTLRTNFAAREGLLCFSGVAPVKKQSGSQQVVHFRYARPLFLHQSIVEFAKCSIGQCEWARLLYDQERKNKKSHWAAIRKVAFKWVRILWRCWQDRQPYDEARYLRRLKEHGVALYAPLYDPLPAA